MVFILEESLISSLSTIGLWFLWNKNSYEIVSNSPAQEKVPVPCKKAEKVRLSLSWIEGTGLKENTLLRKIQGGERPLSQVQGLCLLVDRDAEDQEHTIQEHRLKWMHSQGSWPQPRAGVCSSRMCLSGSNIKVTFYKEDWVENDQHVNMTFKEIPCRSL